MKTEKHEPYKDSNEKEQAFEKLLNILEDRECYTEIHKDTSYNLEESDSIRNNIQRLFDLKQTIWLGSTENRSVNDRGELDIYEEEADDATRHKLSPIRTMTITCPYDLEKIQSFPFLYIVSVCVLWVKTLSEPYRVIELSFMECNLRKKKVTFTITEEIFEKFNILADKLAINKSKFIENKMKELLQYKYNTETNKISIVIDTETGQEKIGDVEGGFNSIELKKHIQKYGICNLLEIMAWMNFQIFETYRELNSEKDKNLIDGKM